MITVQHDLEARLTCSAWDKLFLRPDVHAAYNRFLLSKDHSEFAALTRDQVIMFLIISGEPQGSDVWKIMESLIGESL